MGVAWGCLGGVPQGGLGRQVGRLQGPAGPLLEHFPSGPGATPHIEKAMTKLLGPEPQALNVAWTGIGSPNFDKSMTGPVGPEFLLGQGLGPPNPSRLGASHGESIWKRKGTSFGQPILHDLM